MKLCYWEERYEVIFVVHLMLLLISAQERTGSWIGWPFYAKDFDYKC